MELCRNLARFEAKEDEETADVFKFEFCSKNVSNYDGPAKKYYALSKYLMKKTTEFMPEILSSKTPLTFGNKECTPCQKKTPEALETPFILTDLFPLF